MNTNGLLSFGMPQPSYLSSSLPLADLPLVAPFLGDVDTRGSGEVFFRQTNNQSLLASVGTQIQMSFMDSLQFLPTSVFIATWSNVGYYDMHTELVRLMIMQLMVSYPIFCTVTFFLKFTQTNTFQAILATNGTRSFALFQYADIQWALADPRTDTSTATASGSGGGEGTTTVVSGSGSGSGSGDAVLAQVGFSAGDGMRYYVLNASGTYDVLRLNSTSNIDRPGLWIFRVDGPSVQRGGMFVNV